MDDIFKSKDEEKREEKINNLFKSAGGFKKEESVTAPEEKVVPVAETEKKNPKVFWGILAGIVFLLMVSAVGYYFWQYKKIPATSQTVVASSEAEQVAEKVKSLMELPEEKPALTTIADRQKIAEQPFFAKALDGDQVLLYIQSKKAILYRPSSNEVIGTAALFSETASETETRIAKACATQETSQPAEKIENLVKVDVLNGTEIKGLAKETADKLSGMENVKLAKVGNAQKSTYTKILVVDLTGKNETAAKIIAEKVGGEVGILPSEESRWTADILVIAGK